MRGILISIIAVLCLSRACWATESTNNLPAEKQELHQDITDALVRNAWVSKFESARRQHLEKEAHHASSDEPTKKPSKKLTPKQKAEMIAKMKALRKQIESDFASNIKTEKRADCSYPYPAASCAENAPVVPRQKVPADPL